MVRIEVATLHVVTHPVHTAPSSSTALLSAGPVGIRYDSMSAATLREGGQWHEWVTVSM
jgi:hypothetical protein